MVPEIPLPGASVQVGFCSFRFFSLSLMATLIEKGHALMVKCCCCCGVVMTF